MVRKGYGPVNLELDSNNLGTMKIIIQSASGVGSDIVDVYAGYQLRELVAAGVLTDVTALAKEYGFGPEKTYASSLDEISVDGRQYTFPCNVTADVLTINRALLERENLPMAKFDWTWDEFLQWCLKVRRVGADGRVTRYAVMPTGPAGFWRTNGASMFDETMTHSVLDSARAIEATRFYYDLVFKYDVIPTKTDIDAMSTKGGYGGAGVQWLGSGLVVAMPIGRFSLIQLRKFKNFRPDVALYPHKVMPMVSVSARSAGVSSGAKNPRLAARFLQFLSEKTYNDIIVEDADGLPPNPEFTRSAEFLDPPDHPGEQHAHKKYALAAEKYGVTWEYSPFINPYRVMRILKKYVSGLDSQAVGIEEAHRGMQYEINLELRQSVERDVKLQARYKKACSLQAKIDQLKKEGKPIPIEWISNPILRRLREAGK